MTVVNKLIAQKLILNQQNLTETADELYSQQAHNVETTPIQRRFNTETLNRRCFDVVCNNVETTSIKRLFSVSHNVDSTSRRWINVESTLFQRCVPAGLLLLPYVFRPIVTP